MKFMYLRDPVFLLCVAIYVINRSVLKELWPSGFVHDHLNDLICIPLLVPVMLVIQRNLGTRGHDSVPLWYEVLIPLVVWSLLFEVLLPLHSTLASRVVPDHVDVLFYAVGALAAAVLWRCKYRDANTQKCTSEGG